MSLHAREDNRQKWVSHGAAVKVADPPFGDAQFQNLLHQGLGGLGGHLHDHQDPIGAAVIRAHLPLRPVVLELEQGLHGSGQVIVSGSVRIPLENQVAEMRIQILFHAAEGRP